MTKRPSFQFYPGDWRGSRWVTFDPCMSIIPTAPACYVIYLDGALSYVGQASNLRKRLSSYQIRPSYGASTITPWGAFETVSVKARFASRFGDWAMREARLIQRLQPSLNCVGSIKKRAANA